MPEEAVRQAEMKSRHAVGLYESAEFDGMCELHQNDVVRLAI